MAQKLLIIDTDCGIDDALAAPGVKVLGITCCFGNTDVDNVCQNVIWVLTVCQQTQIPGSAGPLIGPVTGFKDHFGTYGLGDVLENSEIWKVQIQKEHAVHALIRLVNENQGEGIQIFDNGSQKGQGKSDTRFVDPANTLKKDHLVFVMRTCYLKKFSCMLKEALQIA
ncbi:hypothetical protein cypCar_00001101 [Cyprinus carpio]|nr:hypothetical protein cypCar_00001101 [Cyprinus carpio]